jgi:hypothetical protein
MFNFGVFLAYVAVPTPLCAAILGAPLWLIVALPATLFALGLACMGIGDMMESGPLPPDPIRRRFDDLLAQARELSDQLWRETEQPALGDSAQTRARFNATMAEANELLQRPRP